MKKIYCLFLFCFACASQPPQKTVVNKSHLKRVDEKVVNSGMPNFYLIDYQFNQGRAPASIEEDESKLAELSNRKIYFLTLYSQHIWFKSILKVKSDDVKTCPQFHHELQVENGTLKNLENQSKRQSLVQMSSSSVSEESLPYFPELSLVVESKNSEIYFLLGQNKTEDEWVREALQDHYEKNLKEVQTLCEYGRSDNYYIYENTMAHYRARPEEVNSETALKAFLKIPVVANLYLIHSLTGSRVVAESYEATIKLVFNTYETEVLARLRVNWMQNYLYAVKGQRLNNVAQVSQMKKKAKR